MVEASCGPKASYRVLAMEFQFRFSAAARSRSSTTLTRGFLRSVLVGGRVNGRSQLRAEGIVQSAGDGVPVQVQRRRAVAVEYHIDPRILEIGIGWWASKW